ncbi:MAG: ATP-binding protein, partial [Planctomycetota bacterium]|jgi:tetratricopeptide (TPR) repeat protein
VRIPRETSVYGRDDELARMQALFDSAAAGDGQVLLLEGEAGIGKTRLVDEFVSRFGEEVNFLFGSYPPGGAATEAGAFSTAFREQLGDQQLSGYLDETPLLAPAFGALLRGEPPPRGEQPLSKDSLQTVFLQSARVLARERPTILLIDDLHFAPPEGRALFAALAMGVPGHRILLVGTARPELPTDWRAGIESMPHSTRLKLTRLGAKDLAKLLVDYFGSERLAHELSFSIATSSDGNPFFVFEIIRGLREGNYITRSDDGSWITSRIIEKIEIPSSVAELIQARISTLCEEDHEILDVASCCGFDFDATVVADVIRQPRIPTFRRLARITNEHRLVHASGRNFVFDHHQVQETLYAALPEILREEYHAAIGNALEQRDPRGSELVHLCKHFFLGGQPERAQPHLDAALDHLSKGYLHEAALELLDRALAVPGFYEGAARVRKMIDKSKQLNSMGRRDEQLAVAEEALTLADECGDLKSRARARVGIAAHLGNTSQFEAAEKLAREVLEMGCDAEDKEVEAVGHEYLALLALHGGKTESATEHFEAAIAIHAHLDDPRGKASLLTNHGAVLRSLGDYEGARALHEESRAVALAAGDREGVGLAAGNLGMLCRSQGWIGDALANFEACAEEFRQIGSRRPFVNALAEVGKTLIPLGDIERAKRTLEDAVEIADEIQYGYLVAWCERYLARIAALEGRVNDADALLTTALARMQEFPSPGDVAETLCELAELRGPGEEAQSLLREALAATSQGHFHAETAVAQAMLGDLPGDIERLPALARMRVHFHLWETGGDWAHLERAHDVLTHLREHAPERYRKPMIESVPLHRQIVQAWASRPST